MNVTEIIIEQLDWEGTLRTAVFTPRGGTECWIAYPDEYRDRPSDLFHFMNSRHERQFARAVRRPATRAAGKFRELEDGSVFFMTQWRGIATDRTSLSVYAICLPVEAVPDTIEFSDPHASGRSYRSKSAYDRERDGVVCYLECRSRYGSFDFDLNLQLRRDARAYKRFSSASGDNHVPEIEWLESVIDRSDRTVQVQAFFSGSTSIQAGNHGTVISDSKLDNPIIIGEASGTIGAIGRSARGQVVQTDAAHNVLMHRDQVLAELQKLSAVARAMGNPQLKEDVDVAEESVKTGKVEEIRKTFGKLSKSGLGVARAIGVELLAALIEAHTGLR